MSESHITSRGHERRRETGGARAGALPGCVSLQEFHIAMKGGDLDLSTNGLICNTTRNSAVNSIRANFESIPLSWARDVVIPFDPRLICIKVCVCVCQNNRDAMWSQGSIFFSSYFCARGVGKNRASFQLSILVALLFFPFWLVCRKTRGPRV